VRQFHCEVAQGANAGLELRLAVIDLRGANQFVCCALGTEVVRVRDDSVVAVVLPRDDDCEQLALDA
jgi:hypothetical protein